MRLSVNLVVGGRYVKAGDHLPVDFVLPPHLDRFVVNDDSPPPQISRATSRFSTERHQEDFGPGSQLAKPAMATYPEGEEKFAPRWAKKIRRVLGEERKGKL